MAPRNSTVYVSRVLQISIIDINYRHHTHGRHQSMRYLASNTGWKKKPIEYMAPDTNTCK